MIKDGLLYFSPDVVDEVYERFGGKYTKEQIWDVFDSSISYIHKVMGETDCISLYIKYIGYMMANAHDMEVKVRSIKKKGKGTKAEMEEIKLMEEKIERIKRDHPSFRPLVSNIPLSLRRMRKGKTWEQIQKFQNKIRF